MSPNQLCPISYNRIDENIARIIAAQTVVLLVWFLLTSHLFPLLLLLVDFALRSSGQSAHSPLAFLSRKLQSGFKLRSRLVNAGPKLFASRVGVVFSLILLPASVLGFHSFASVVAIVFALCAFLEAALGFCVACRLYPLFYRFGSKLAS